MKWLFSFVICSLVVISCDKDKDQEDIMDGEFVFGITFGECQGDCAEFYLLKDEKLYYDKVDYGFQNIEFSNNTVKNSALVERAEDLKISLPSYLKENEDMTFGCPDCGDWGAIYVSITTDGVKSFWHLDNMNSGNPEEIQAYVESIQQLLMELE